MRQRIIYVETKMNVHNSFKKNTSHLFKDKTGIGMNEYTCPHLVVVRSKCCFADWDHLRTIGLFKVREH